MEDSNCCNRWRQTSQNDDISHPAEMGLRGFGLPLHFSGGVSAERRPGWKLEASEDIQAEREANGHRPESRFFRGDASGCGLRRLSLVAAISATSSKSIPNCRTK